MRLDFALTDAWHFGSRWLAVGHVKIVPVSFTELGSYPFEAIRDNLFPMRKLHSGKILLESWVSMGKPPKID